MERKDIAQLAHQMETKEELLQLLNFLKEDEMREAGLAEHYHPFSMKLLNYYCNPNNTFHRYEQFKIKKKSGGFRLITAPKNRSFKLILQYVNEIFKVLYTPSTHAMGFTEGRSVVTNASVHIGKNYILNLDLKDFFPSVEQPRIWKRLQIDPLNFKKPVANVLAGLCCMKQVEKDERGNVIKTNYVLPQGAPTSPIITNMICDKLDRRLAGLAKRFGLDYTRYADDITFSSMHNVYSKNGAFFTELRRIITDQGFTLNEKKTRLQKRGSRQEVTSVIVSNKVNVSQKYVRDIRNILYIWKKYGYGVAYSKFFPKYKADKGHVKKGNPDMVNVLNGKLLYLKMVKGEQDSVYLRLNATYNDLVKGMNTPGSTNEHEVTYIETIPLVDFEKKYSTSLMFSVDKNGKRKGYYMIEGKSQNVFINKVLSPKDLADKKGLAISFCRDGKGKPFQLIHKISKVTVPVPEPVDLDELEDELDEILNENG